MPGYGLGSNIGQGIDRYILGSDYYFQGDRGLLDWASDVGVSGITTILPVEMYGYYKAIGGMAAVKYTFMGDSAVSGGKASQTTAMKVDSVVSNPLPKDGVYARVMPEKYAKSLKSGAGNLSYGDEAWITAREDLVGIKTVEAASKRLTLVDGAGNLRLDGNSIVEFKLRDIADISSPINRDFPGFIGGGRTAGGAREWIIPSNKEIYDVIVRLLE